MGAALAAAILLQAPAAELRTIAVSVLDERGAPVAGLVPDDVAVLENGVAREVARIEPDKRPLTLAILVDSSEPLGPNFRLNVVGAVTGFIAHLPDGTRYALWTTGDRPVKRVDYTDDPSAAGPALKRVYPQGGNTVLDALVEAAQDLKKQEGTRSMVLAVVGLGLEYSNLDRYRVIEQAIRSGAVFNVVQIDELPTSFEDRHSFEFVFTSLTQRSGGLLETVLHSMALPAALQKLGADLAAQYRLSYASLSDVKNPKLDVTVARPGVRVRVVSQGSGS